MTKGYGSQLKSIITSRNVVYSRLAEDLNVATSTISNWCNSEYPPLEGIEKVCEYFNIPLSEFFGKSEKESMIDEAWLNIGLVLQPAPTSLKNRLYAAILQIVELLLSQAKDAQAQKEKK